MHSYACMSAPMCVSVPDRAAVRRQPLARFLSLGLSGRRLSGHYVDFTLSPFFSWV